MDNLSIPDIHATATPTADILPPGPAAKLHQLFSNVRRPLEVHTIEEYRKELADAYKAIKERANSFLVYVCNAPTGTGKTYQLNEVIRLFNEEGKITVTFAPTHQLCEEIAEQRRAVGINSAAFPELNKETCARYDEAKEVEVAGLSPVLALCPKCPYREGCEYREQRAAAKQSIDKVATHALGHVSLPVITNGASLICSDEDCKPLLTPKYTLSEYTPRPGEKPNIDRAHPLRVVAHVADQAAEAAADAYARSFYRSLARIARHLDNEHHAAYETVEVEPPTKELKRAPKSLHADLYQAMIDLGIDPSQRPTTDAMRIALLATQGRLRLIAVVKNEHLGKGGEHHTYNVLTAVGQTQLPLNVLSIFCDATSDPEEIRSLVGGNGHVHDITPRGTLPNLKPVVQICPQYDVIKTRRLEHAGDILRGVMEDVPTQYRRVGLITHKALYDKDIKKEVGEPYSSRIALQSYFGDGLSRGSNEWIKQCDVLIILGTPRPGSNSIRDHLITVMGKTRAARLTEKEADWHLEIWEGISESGHIIPVQTPRYRNEDWHSAYCAITKKQIWQAAGRGRSILPEGIPVYIVTTEDISDYGLARHAMTPKMGESPIMQQRSRRIPIASAGYPALNYDCAAILRILEARNATARSRAIKTGLITRDMYGTEEVCSKQLEHVKHCLSRLHDVERIARKAKRSGWYLPQA